MEEQLISFDTAKLAKEKLFNTSVIKYYTPKGYLTESEGYQTKRLESSDWNNGMGSYPTLSDQVECSAPTQSLLQKWLREIHNLSVIPIYGNDSYWFNVYDTKNNHLLIGSVLQGLQYKTYEEALEKGMKEALNLIK